MAISNKNRRGLHPAVSIFSWLVFALAVECAPPSQLAWLAVPAIILLFHREAAPRFLRLAWKAKWLWLALIGLYAFTLPGVYLWQGNYSPTIEGLYAGGWRVSRLLLLLVALAWLLAEFSPHQLAGGLYVLTAPFERLGFDRRALAVRLALTLQHLQAKRAERDWLKALRPSAEPAEGPEEIRLQLPAVSVYDGGLLLSACTLLGISLL